MAIVPTNNYVKFIRGTTAAFTALTVKDPNTLYFISDDNVSGKLYLGSKLISGGGGGSSDVANLNDLADVVISTVGDKQLLIYNAETSKWENAAVSTLISVMVGASATTAGKSGLVPAPKQGDQNKFLRGDGTWVTLDIDEDLTNGILDEAERRMNEINSSLADLRTQVNNMDAAVLDSRITDLEATVNGTDEKDGLVAITTNLSAQLSRVNTRLTTVEESVTWSELTE